MSDSPVRSLKVDQLSIQIYSDREQMGRAAAAAVAERISTLLRSQPLIRMVFAAAPSQDELLAELVSNREIDWFRIAAFHMDEYLSLPPEAPQRFGNYLKERLFEKVPFRAVHIMNSTVEEPAAECARYNKLITAAPIGIVCLGIGENGHIAFNDPPVADFQDRDTVKVVELDDLCRQQQVNDGAFKSIGDVPQLALTLTIPALMSGRHLFCVVPGPAKAEAVCRTLYGSIEVDCPASILRRHDSAILFLDLDSASKIPEEPAGSSGT